MKNIFLIILGLLFMNPVFAQTSEENPTQNIQPKKRQEIGLFSNLISNSRINYNMPVIGLQYKKWTKPNFAYRISIGFSPESFYYEPRIIKIINEDSIIMKNKYYNQSSFYLGGGVQVDRHFYKSLYLFAALDALIGYGFGSINTYEYYKRADYLNGTSYSNSFNFTKKDYSSLQFRIVPSIGARLDSKKINVGMSMCFIDIAANTEFIKGEGSYFNPQLSMFGNTTYSFFINYRI